MPNSTKVKSRNWGRSAGLLLALAFFAFAVGFVWQRVYGGGATSAQLNGWPERIQMGCASCNHRFDLSASVYVEGMNRMGEGGKSPSCPQCGSGEVGRVEHLENRQHRFERVPDDL